MEVWPINSNLSLSGAGDIFHERGEGVAAGMRRVFVARYAAFCGGRVIYPGGFQNAVERGSVGAQGQAAAVRRTKHRSGGFAAGEPVDDGLNFRGDGDCAISLRFGFGAADECAFHSIVVLHIQVKQFGRTETEIALSKYVVGVGNGIYQRPQLGQL